MARKCTKDRKRFAEIRKRLGLTQSELAERLGVTQNTVGRYEQGLRRISPTIWLLMEQLNDNTPR